MKLRPKSTVHLPTMDTYVTVCYGSYFRSVANVLFKSFVFRSYRTFKLYSTGFIDLTYSHFLHGKNDFAKNSKILLDADLKISLLDQNNCVENTNK